VTKTADWFTVDRKGLAKLLERRGKEFVVYELLSNALDTEAKEISIDLKARPGKRVADLIVVDDHPDGWRNLDHAYTLFAESEKKGDAEKRGRFNLGEKLVLALCEEAAISTTTGTVTFNGDGRRRSGTRQTNGSEFHGIIRMTREELDGISKAMMRVFIPEGVRVTFNGIQILHRKPLRRIEATLPTEVADEEGVLRRSARKTVVEIYAPLDGETPSVYELGIPVVETGDKWHYNVLQKVPLNSDRDNVTSGYLHELRTLALNAMYQEVSFDDSTKPWVRDAASDENVSYSAIEHVVTQRFGKKRVISDPSDPEGTKLAVSQGYTVISPGSLSGAEWTNVKRFGVALPAGQVTPSPKPYSPDGNPLKIVPPEKYTEGMTRIVDYARALARELMGAWIVAQVATEVTWPYAATYAPGHLTFNLGRLGHAWFDAAPGLEVDKLLIHEFAHHYSADHLSEEYHDALCVLGAKLAALALHIPEFFVRHGHTMGGVR